MPRNKSIFPITLSPQGINITFAPVEGSAKGVLPSKNADNQNQRYRGYQMGFTHNASGKVIDLVNFHLNYEYDHRQDLI
ncbi:hypothetical protein [Legionella maioricensis]|uniref:Uncharacterized protein n=1 Tax=Legionella maioricensis TaxID=2896528 RepID=A0A9X2ICM5_9GAMM|nr:hypothetical protein [Legionella maioricensis]MCL9685371.1 hypothetical protein [Legionella maioricensis]MCL9688670.1 hypothetical protein [Legionella maioricensis]